MQTGIQPNTPAPDAAAAEQSPAARITRVIADVVDRRERGELVSESELIARHTDLMPDLARQLQALRLVQRAYATARRAGPIDDPLEPIDVNHLDAPIIPDPEPAPGMVPDDAYPPDDAATPLPKIPGYELIREISSGGQATVYRATRAATGEDVAIKILPGGPFVTSRNRARFDREADILAALHHPNIVGILDRGRTPDGSFFLVMPYVAGVPLDAFGTSCRAGGDAPFPRRLLTVFEKVARAVHAAHTAGVVHRDLKPSNVLVDDRDEPHLLDFGLARLQTLTPLDPDAAPISGGLDWRRHTVTVSGQVIGSLPWSSPEQAAGHSGKVDARADVYALGVCLYEALTGRLPLPSVGGVKEALDHICNTAPAPLGTTRRRITGAAPDAVEAVVLRALAKSPDRRQPTAAAFADEIRAALEGRPVPAAPAPLPYVQPARRRVPHAWIVAVAVVCACTLPAWYFWPQLRPAPAGVVVFRLPRQVNGFGMLMLRIPPGSIAMGTPQSNRAQRGDNEPLREVRITRPYWISETEVTLGQYQRVIGHFPVGVDPNLPVDPRIPATLVSWDDATEFCRKLSQREQKSYRLPTEAEWEYACRAGAHTPFAGDGNPDHMAWHHGNSGLVAHVVATAGWNHWGLYDMHGNVAEWCLDHYTGALPQEADDPLVTLDDPRAPRVVRGGSFLTWPTDARSASRNGLSPDTRRRDVGFRVVLDDDPASPATAAASRPAGHGQ